MQRVRPFVLAAILTVFVAPPAFAGVEDAGERVIATSIAGSIAETTRQLGAYEALTWAGAPGAHLNIALPSGYGSAALTAASDPATTPLARAGAALGGAGALRLLAETTDLVEATRLLPDSWQPAARYLFLTGRTDFGLTVAREAFVAASAGESSPLSGDMARGVAAIAGANQAERLGLWAALVGLAALDLGLDRARVGRYLTGTNADAAAPSPFTLTAGGYRDGLLVACGYRW